MSYDNNVIYYKYVDIQAAAAKPKISFLSNVPLRGGGVGGAANKNDRKFLGFAPRELVERGRGAKVSRFVQNAFERSYIIPPKKTEEILFFLVPEIGVEPIRFFRPKDFKSFVSTNSTTRA